MDYGNVTQLTNLHSYAFDPIISPDGCTIAFSADKSAHVMNPDGSGLRRLTSGRRSQFVSAFSPDSLTVAYIDSSTWDDDNCFDICTIGLVQNATDTFH